MRWKSVGDHFQGQGTILRGGQGKISNVLETKTELLSSAARLRSTVRHSLYSSVEGSIEMVFDAALPHDEQCAALDVEFSDGFSMSCDVVSGESWISGGCSDALMEALCFVQNKPHKKGVSDTKVSFEEGLRDVIAIDLILKKVRPYHRP